MGYGSPLVMVNFFSRNSNFNLKGDVIAKIAIKGNRCPAVTNASHGLRCVFHEFSLEGIWLLTYAEGPGNYVLVNL